MISRRLPSTSVEARPSRRLFTAMSPPLSHLARHHRTLPPADQLPANPLTRLLVFFVKKFCSPALDKELLPMDGNFNPLFNSARFIQLWESPPDHAGLIFRNAIEKKHMRSGEDVYPDVVMQKTIHQLEKMPCQDCILKRSLT